MKQIPQVVSVGLEPRTSGSLKSEVWRHSHKGSYLPISDFIEDFALVGKRSVYLGLDNKFTSRPFVENVG